MPSIAIGDDVFASFEDMKLRRPDLYHYHMGESEADTATHDESSGAPDAPRFRCTTTGCGYDGDHDGKCPCCENYSLASTL